MAIELVGITSGNTDNTTSVTLNVPSGTADGDVIILMTSCDGTSGYNTPSGFTLVSSQSIGASHVNKVFYRVAESEPTSYILNPASSERSIAIFATYRGVSTTIPIDSYDNSSSGTGTAGVIPSFTPTTDNCQVIAFDGHENGNAGNTIVSSWVGNFTEQLDNVNGPPGTGAASSAGAFADQLQSTATDVGGNFVISDSSDWGVTVFALTDGIPAVIGIDDISASKIDDGDTNIVINGFGFETSQSNGKVEVCNSSSYGTSTIKVTQSIDSWSDTSIQFDFVNGTHVDGSVWIFVTNDNGDVTRGKKLAYGIQPYIDYILEMNNPPDIFHTLDNTYDDAQGVAAANSQDSNGSHGFQAVPLVRGASYSWACNDAASNMEMNDTTYTNITTTHTQRVIGGWISLPKIFLEPTGFYEEGGGINNLYFIVGFGNILLANIADSNGSPAFKAQAYSDFKLSVDRPYHVIMKFIGGIGFTMFIDGIEVSRTSGNPIEDTTMSTHSGNWSYGRPDSSLDTGGTDIQYPSGEDLLVSYFGTWSAVDKGIPPDEDIRNMFELGARETDLIFSDTSENMQTAIDNLSDTSYIDKPLPLKIKKMTGGGNFTLSLDNITFDERCSIHIQFLGGAGETLTIVNNNGSNCDSSKCSTPYGGSINIITPYTVTVAGVVDNSKIVIFDHSNQEIVDSIENSNGDFVVSVLVPTIDIVIIADHYNIIQKNGLSISGNSIVPIVQQADYNYYNPI